jgi:hypothetical protein
MSRTNPDSAQVAFSLVLLMAALLFVRSFRNIITLNAGFQQDHILVADFEFSPLKLPPASQMAFKHELLSRVKATPGVNSAAEVLMVPMSHSGWDDNIDVPDGAQRQDVTLNRVSPGTSRPWRHHCWWGGISTKRIRRPPRAPQS